MRPPTTPTRLDRLLDRVAERTSLDIVVHIFVRILRRAAYGRRIDELVDRAALAGAQLRLVAPAMPARSDQQANIRTPLGHWRVERGIRQEDLAAAIGISHTTYRELETGS